MDFNCLADLPFWKKIGEVYVNRQDQRLYRCIMCENFSCDREELLWMHLKQSHLYEDTRIGIDDTNTADRNVPCTMNTSLGNYQHYAEAKRSLSALSTEISVQCYNNHTNVPECFVQPHAVTSNTLDSHGSNVNYRENTGCESQRQHYDGVNTNNISNILPRNAVTSATVGIASGLPNCGSSKKSSKKQKKRSEETFPCPYCEKVYRLYNLKRHIRSYHRLFMDALANNRVAAVPNQNSPSVSELASDTMMSSSDFSSSDQKEMQDMQSLPLPSPNEHTVDLSQHSNYDDIVVIGTIISDD